MRGAAVLATIQSHPEPRGERAQRGHAHGLCFLHREVTRNKFLHLIKDKRFARLADSLVSYVEANYKDHPIPIVLSLLYQQLGAGGGARGGRMEPDDFKYIDDASHFDDAAFIDSITTVCARPQSDRVPRRRRALRRLERRRKARRMVTHQSTNICARICSVRRRTMSRYRRRRGISHKRSIDCTCSQWS